MRRQLREFVRRRAEQRCEYCHLPEEFSEIHFHVEHAIPRQHRGSDSSSNRAFACPDCNLVKGPNLTAIDPLSRKIVRLFNPRHHEWIKHFRFVGARIVGLTPVGRATVALLKMNNSQRLRLRALLIELGMLN